MELVAQDMPVSVAMPDGMDSGVFQLTPWLVVKKTAGVAEVVEVAASSPAAAQASFEVALDTHARPLIASMFLGKGTVFHEVPPSVVSIRATLVLDELSPKAGMPLARQYWFTAHETAESEPTVLGTFGVLHVDPPSVVTRSAGANGKVRVLKPIATQFSAVEHETLLSITAEPDGRDVDWSVHFVPASVVDATNGASTTGGPTFSTK